MTLEELKKALAAAKKASEAKPEDEKLKSALATAQEAVDNFEEPDDDEDDEDDSGDKSKKKSSSGKGGDDEPNEDDLDEMLKDPKKAKGYLKSLRKENAKYRTKGKNLEDRLGRLEKGLKGLTGDDDDSKTPEEKLEAATQRAEALAYEKTILELAMQYEIVGKEGRDLFEFYVGKASKDLKEGEEISEEDFASIAEKVQKMTKKGPKSSSIEGSEDDEDEDDESDSDRKPNPKGSGNLSLDKFVSMTISQKTELYNKNPAVYNKLFKEANSKKRL